MAIQRFGLWLRLKSYTEGGTLAVSLISGQELGDTAR